MSDLFVEIFPIKPDAIPPITAYQISMEEDVGEVRMDRLGLRLARRLRRAYPGMWLWSEGRILTDNERNPVELMITVDLLKSEQPGRYGLVQAIDPDPNWLASSQVQAEFVMRTRLHELADSMQTVLDKQNTRIRNASTQREHRLQTWVVNSQPAISISIASRLLYDQTVQQYAGAETDIDALNEKLAGLWAADKSSGIRGEIAQAVGAVKDHRERLVEAARNEAERAVFQRAPEDELVIVLKAGQREYEYLAGMLRLIVRLPHLRRFDVDSRQAIQTLQMKPAVRAAQVKAVSDIAKEAGVLENAYNARIEPDLFFSADFQMNLRFGKNRVRPYNIESLPYDFTQCGVYRLRNAFKAAPVRVCVVNTLTLKLEDFVEALQRQLQRHFDFAIDVIRERQVRVVSRANLERAVRVVEKEDPHIILAFFPDEIESGDDEDSDVDATAAYIKSLTLGRGIPTHVIYQSTLDDPEAMPSIIMSILGKTGSSPFVLVEPLEHADYVVGLDIVREFYKTSGDIRLTAIARVYRADGEFVQYLVSDQTMQEELPPYVLLRDLLPQRIFAKKRVIFHHDGEMAPDLLAALARWGQAIGATFYPVEIMRFGSPRIYAIDKPGIVQPPWGSAFKLSDTEGLLVSSRPRHDVSPQPLHIRTVSAEPVPPLPIEKALRGILVWTLLAFGADRPPKLPVTVINADELAYWLRKGGRFGESEGEVPFWL